MNKIEIILYSTAGGKEPYSDWENRLDKVTRAIVIARLARLRQGNFGDVKPIKSGVWELRIDYGPGYRIYLGKKGLAFVVLLIGGSKKSQNRDIEKAEKYWQDYKGLK